ncbi:APC family permease [Clostridium senegalense]|uniref:Amino acid permease n=1 Tax=Clostridium senegalense TaxID=1465809 RepID=A0A6M0H4G6_9CLOT|nr:amino acid permease [Clostridium senegalense]NEU05124.1 amino acid permease [Clostridium senegalense]
MSQENKRSMGLKEAISIVVGVVIGSGVFFKASVVFKEAGSPLLGILAWLIAGLITICAGLTVAEIASAIPKEGGLYAYLTELYGDVVGFLYGWVQVVIYFPAVIAASAIVLAETASPLLGGLSAIQQKLLAVGLIIFMALVHMVSTKLVGKVQVIATVGKLLPLAAIIIFGIINGKSGELSTISFNGFTAGGFGAALIGCLWAYDGWISVGTLAGEIKEPEKNLPKAIIGGLTIVMAVYVLFSVGIIKTLPMDQVIGSSAVAADTASVLFGSIGGVIISLGMLISVFGALNGNMMAGSRMPVAMAKERKLPASAVLEQINPKFGTPINSIILLSVIALVYVASGSFQALTDMIVFVLWVFFVMGVFGVFLVRKRKMNASYKVPLFPIIPLIGIIGGIYIVISCLTSSFTNAVVGTVLTLVGLPVFLYLKKKNTKETGSGKNVA